MKKPASRPGADLRPAFTIIDLFAGIGGMRMAFERSGGRCVFISERDRFAQETYRANFDCAGHALAGDIRAVPADAIPPHDVLLAGFPCQPFSLAGMGGKNGLGRPHGFSDRVQGTLFFDLARVIAHHRPKAFLLENVRHLLHHDQGRTFQAIIETLRDALGYRVQWRVLNAKDLLPQSRNRVFIAGFRSQTAFDLEQFSIAYPCQAPVIGDILQRRCDLPPSVTLSNKGLAWVERQAARHRERGNRFRTRYLGPRDTLPALLASYGADRAFFIRQRGRNPRRLAPRECARAMGFPDSFVIPVSRTQAYRQFGNSVAVPLVAQLAAAMAPAIRAMTSEETPFYSWDHAYRRDHRWPRAPDLSGFLPLPVLGGRRRLLTGRRRSTGTRWPRSSRQSARRRLIRRARTNIPSTASSRCKGCSATSA